MNGFLEYKSGNSVFHKMNPLSKLILAIALCAACFISSKLLFILAIIFVNLIISYVVGIHKMTLSIIWNLSKMLIIFFVIQVLFVRTGDVIFTIPGLGIPITKYGVYYSLLFVMRLIATALPLAVMLSVTQMSDLSNVMVSKLKIPYKYAFAIITIIRFIPVFAADMSGIMEAQTARGVEFDSKNIFKKISLLIPLCVPLLISSIKRVDSSAMAAELRGFNRRTAKSGYKKYPFKKYDAVAALICVAVITGAVVSVII